MRFLITGGAGFIGSHLAERLILGGHSVSIIDNLSTGRIENVARGADLTLGDCRNELLLASAAKGCEFIYHLASSVGVSKVLEDPKECIENNIESTRAVAALCRPGIFTSTSEVYGKNTSVLSEDSDVVFSDKPRWSYAASKLACEWLALAAGMNVVRLFNVVGKRQSRGYALSNFVAAAKSGQPITVYGDGNQVRTLIDVRDAAEILYRLRSVPDFGAVNLGGAHTCTVKDMAHTVKRVLVSDSQIVSVPYGEAYPEGFEECPSRIPNLKKLRGLIGAIPGRPIEETIMSID